MSNYPQPGQFCWSELATTNVQAAKDFYGKLFDWKFYDVKMDDSTYTMIKHKDQEFGGIWQIPREQENEIPPNWLSYILVENLEDSVEKVKQLGGQIVKPPMEAGDMGRLAVITDPTGAHIALWESKV